MVPMLTCGLVRSNLALATVGPPQDSDATPPGASLSGCRSVGPRCVCLYFTWWRGARRRAPPPVENTLRGALLSLGLRDDLLGDVRRDLVVGLEGHRVDGTTGGLRTKVPDVAEHLGQRHARADHLDARGVLHRGDVATTG